MNLIEIGHNIKLRRQDLRITQKDLSEIVEISLRSVVDIENGKGNPTFTLIEKMLTAVGLTLETRLKK